MTRLDELLHQQKELRASIQSLREQDVALQNQEKIVPVMLVSMGVIG